MISTLPPINGGVALKFNAVVQVLESDNRVTTRFMNPDGTVYRHAEEIAYDDDSCSFNLGINEDYEMTFLDALQEDAEVDDGNGLDLFQSRG